MIISKLIKSTLTATLLVSALATAASAKDGVLRIGTEGDAPKFSMADASGNVTGFDADIAKGICAELKLKCEFVVQAFSSLVPSMDSDRFDVIISGLSITDERAKKIDYSIPYATTPQYFVVAKDSPIAKLTTLAEVQKALAGKSVGVVNGTTYAKFVQKTVPSADLKTYDATTQQLADLSSGRIDAAYSDSPTVMDFLATSDGANFAKVEVKVMAMDDPATLGKGMGVGMKKGNTELKTKIDTALCKMINDGQVKKASMQWFQDDYTIPCKK